MNVLEQQLDEYRRNDDGSIIQGAAHTSRILNHKYRNKIIINAYTKLNKLDIYYDSIACCGTSGLMVVPQIAELLKKNIIVVRKQKDGYSDFLVEGPSSKQYIIIDDLICSGGTVKHIIKNSNPQFFIFHSLITLFIMGMVCHSALYARSKPLVAVRVEPSRARGSH